MDAAHMVTAGILGDDPGTLENGHFYTKMPMGKSWKVHKGAGKMAQW